MVSRNGAGEAEQIIFAHDPRYALAIHRPALLAQLLCDTPISIVAALAERDLLLHLRAYVGLLYVRLVLLPVTIKSLGT